MAEVNRQCSYGWYSKTIYHTSDTIRTFYNIVFKAQCIYLLCDKPFELIRLEVTHVQDNLFYFYIFCTQVRLNVLQTLDTLYINLATVYAS